MQSEDSRSHDCVILYHCNENEQPDMAKEKTKPVGEGMADVDTLKELILYNDDINTFQFVIESLIEVCEHDFLQAETCAYLAHYKGKCAVKSGTFSDLRPKYDEMTRRGLTVEIE
jgi:ATP-dependent Clp protease adaptor protein ClpS